MNAAHQRGVRVVPTITMHAWDYNYTAMTALLNSATYRAKLVSNVVTIVRDRRADGVNIDFEPVPTSLRAAFTSFIRQLKAGLVAARVGSYVTVDTMAGAAAWATGYDVAALTAAGAADAIMVMALRLLVCRLRPGRRRRAIRQRHDLCRRRRAARPSRPRPTGPPDLGRAVLRPRLEHEHRPRQLDRPQPGQLVRVRVLPDRCGGQLRPLAGHHERAPLGCRRAGALHGVPGQ